MMRSSRALDSLLIGVVACVVVCVLCAYRGSRGEGELENFSLRIREALKEGVDRLHGVRVVVPIPASFEGGVLCVTGPYSITSSSPGLLELVGEAAFAKMQRGKGYDETRYFFYIDDKGGVVWVSIDWPVFLGGHFELRVVGGKALVLILEGNGLVGIDLQ